MDDGSEGKGGVPDWVLTYGDMMSLLLCFFVLLYSFAGGARTTQLDAVIESIIKQFGDTQDLARFSMRRQLNAATNPGKAVSESKAGALKQLHANAAQPGPLGERSRVQDVREGKRLIIGGPVVFEAGSAELAESAKKAALEAAELIRGKFHLVDVRAFEPPVLPPSAVGFRDPLDLAYARAKAVADLLKTEGKIHPEIIRISIAAPVESETLPRLPNGEPMYNRVVVSNLEASPGDFEGAGK